jgi:parvulin-like peptidyl-prolyl isomerase
MKLSWKSPLIALPLLVILGCSRGDSGTTPNNLNAVASFSGGVITKEQLKAKFESLLPCCKVRYQGEEGARGLVKEMVLPAVISQAIKQKKIDLRGNIREELGNLTDELNMSFLHMKFHEQILNSNEKYRDLRENYNYQRKVLNGYPLSERFNRLAKLHQKIHHKIDKEVEKVAQDYIRKLRKEASITKNYEVLRVKVTGEELKDFYERHKEGLHGEEYRVPERVRVQEIRIKVNRENEDCPTCTAKNEQKAREKAESVLIELRSGAQFRSVAKKYGGDTHETVKSTWVAKGSNGKAFEEAVFSLEIGEISQVLKKEDAFHIVKILERQPGRFKAYGEIKDQIKKEYEWQKGEDYLKENKDRILFTINAKPYTIADFIKEYTRDTPDHQCHHMEKMDKEVGKGESPQLCDFAHNDFEEQKKLVDRMIDKELITEDTYNQMIQVEYQKEIEFLTMASLYPIFHQEEMEDLIQITDKMVEDYYQKHEEDFLYPANAKISLIVSRGGEKEEEKKRAFEKARMAYKELKPSFFSFKKGDDFAEVARKYSDDKETASRGGRMEVDIYECRNQVEYMLLHGFHKKIFQVKPGDISDIFEFGGDYYIVQMREMESRKQMTFEKVRDEVKKDLVDKEHQKIMVNWEDDLLRSAGFVVYDQTLKEAMAEASTETKESRNVKGS